MEKRQTIELKGAAISDLYAFIISNGYSPSNTNIVKLAGKFLQATRPEYIPLEDNLSVDINAEPGMLPTCITVSFVVPEVSKAAQDSWSKEQSDYIVKGIIDSLKTMTMEAMTDAQYANLMEQLQVNDTWPVMLPTSRLAPVKPLNLDFAIQELHARAKDNQVAALAAVDSEALMRAAVLRYRAERLELRRMLEARGISPDEWGRLRFGRALKSNWLPIDDAADFVAEINAEIKRLRDQEPR